MIKVEKEHVEKIGQQQFDAALARAMLTIKSDARLTGLDKVRPAMAEKAALKATGFSVPGFAPPKGCGSDNAEFQEICDDVFLRAVEAAKTSAR